MDIIAGSFSKKKMMVKNIIKKTEDKILIWFYIHMHHYSLVFYVSVTALDLVLLLTLWDLSSQSDIGRMKIW